MQAFTLVVAPIEAQSSATGVVAANGNSWGTLDIWTSGQDDYQRTLVAFLGQQLALSLNKAALLVECADAKKNLRDLESELHTRKVVQRAAGLIARRHGIPARVAEARIRTLGRKTGRPLKAVAEEVITAEAMQSARSDELRTPVRLLA